MGCVNTKTQPIEPYSPNKGWKKSLSNFNKKKPWVEAPKRSDLKYESVVNDSFMSCDDIDGLNMGNNKKTVHGSKRF